MASRRQTDERRSPHGPPCKLPNEAAHPHSATTAFLLPDHHRRRAKPKTGNTRSPRVPNGFDWFKICCCASRRDASHAPHAAHTRCTQKRAKTDRRLPRGLPFLLVRIEPKCLHLSVHSANFEVLLPNHRNFVTNFEHKSKVVRYAC